MSRWLIMVTTLLGVVIFSGCGTTTKIDVERTTMKAGEIVERVTVKGTAPARDSGYTHLDWAGVVKFTMSDSNVVLPDYEAIGKIIESLECARNPSACPRN